MDGRMVAQPNDSRLAASARFGKFRRGPRLAMSWMAHFLSRPEVRREYPLNLSISIRGGKETNKDSLSNGE